MQNINSWHLSLMALILEERSKVDIDISKVLKMLLIHNVVEIDARDIFLIQKIIMIIQMKNL